MFDSILTVILGWVVCYCLEAALDIELTIDQVMLIYIYFGLIQLNSTIKSYIRKGEK